MIKYELYKIFFNKVSMIFIAIILVVNVFQLVWLEDNRYGYPASAYCSMWADLEARAGDSHDEWRTVLGELKTELEEMQSADLINADCFLAEYTGRPIYEIRLYSRVIKEIESTLGYGEYLEGIELTKKRFDAMGSFVDKDDYVYRNLVKTAEVYAGITGKELIPASSAGVTMAVGSDVTDVFGVALFLFFGITVWLKEKEQGVLVLARTTRNGRVRLAMAKMSALAVACAMCGALLYLTGIVAACITYGLGDVTRPLAAVDGYRGTLWQINVCEFLMFNLFIKLTVYVWLSLLVSTVCVWVRTSVAAFGGMAIICAGGYALYTGIPALSAWAVIKYLNPFGMIKTQLLFQEFRGLNIFGWPLDYRKCVAGVLAVGTVIFTMLTARLFVRTPLRSGLKAPSFVDGFSLWYIGLRRRAERHVSLAGHECHRIFINGGILFVVVAALVFMILLNQPYRVRYMNLEDYYERQYLEELSGPVTDEKKTYLENERTRFKRAADELEEGQKKAVNAVIGRLAYLEANEGTYFIYDEPFGLLSAANGNRDDISGTVVFMMLLALSMPVFFAPEWQTGMRKVVSGTLHGRRKLKRVRYVIGVLLVLVLFVVSYLPPFTKVMASYEVDMGLFAYPAGSLMHLEEYGAKLSIGMYLFIVGTLRFLAGVLAAFFIYKISALIKSHIYTMTAAFAVFLIPAFIALADRDLEPVMYPYAAFTGNMAMQNSVAAVVCVVTVIVISVALYAVNHRRKVR